MLLGLFSDDGEVVISEQGTGKFPVGDNPVYQDLALERRSDTATHFHLAFVHRNPNNTDSPLFPQRARTAACLCWRVRDGIAT